MNFKLEVSGMMVAVRRWKKHSSFGPSEDERHPVVVLGARGRGDDEVPLHVPRLTMPLAMVMDTDLDPLAIVSSPDGQLGIWDLTGWSVSLEGPDQTGVEYRDRMRPSGYGSPNPNSPRWGWGDVAWAADIDRVFGRQVTLDVDLDKPIHKYVSFALNLNTGQLRTRKPRSKYDRRSTFAFDPPFNKLYEQAFSDRMRLEFESEVLTLVFTSIGGQSEKKISLQAGGWMHVSSLSTSLTNTTESPDRLTHFKGIYDLFLGLREDQPVPVRTSAPDADGEQTVEPFFCLLASFNVADL